MVRWCLLASMLCSAFTSCCGLYTHPPDSANKAPKKALQSHDARRIYVFSDGWHSGIVMSADDVEHVDWLRPLPLPDNGFVEFGWGDEALFRSEVMTASLTMKALFVPTPTVIRVEWFTEQPFIHYSNMQLRCFDISQADLEKMLIKMRSTMKNSDEISCGEAIAVGPGDVDKSFYYRGKTSYRIGQSCNRWTSTVLREAGFSVRAIFAPALFEQLDRHHRSVR